MPTYRVTGACLDFGLYVAYSEQHAKDLCAIDAGYTSESDMEEQIEEQSVLVATLED